MRYQNNLRVTTTLVLTLLSGGISVGLAGPISLSTVDVPDANATVAQSINDTGQIAGGYNSQGKHGFLFTGKTFATLPAALAHGINDIGQMVGLSVDAAGSRGFLDTSGSFSTIDVPGPSYTSANGIDDAGQIVGFYRDATGNHGLLATPADAAVPPTVLMMMTVLVFSSACWRAFQHL
jgi:uncharacterized membrane protein